jgi:hypothetical protein
MKTLITTTLVLSSLSAFAKVELTCVADDFSPVGIEVVSTGSNSKSSLT